MHLYSHLNSWHLINLILTNKKVMQKKNCESKKRLWHSWFIRSHKFFSSLSSGVLLLLLFLLLSALNVVSLTLKKQIKKTKQKVGESNRIEKADYSCCVVVVSLFSLGMLVVKTWCDKGYLWPLVLVSSVGCCGLLTRLRIISAITARW
jgi:hypothetical protein